MDDAKIQFSPPEVELMCNAGVILTKNKIMHGVKGVLEGIQQQLLTEAYHISDATLREVLEPAPKISKGENYLGLPYLVLDYPRQFDLSTIFAVRTMFWWGHFFSSTLHLSGQYKTTYGEKIQTAYKRLGKDGYYISVNDDPWAHHFETDNYVRIDSLSPEDFSMYCEQFDHLKIAAHWPLRDVHFVSEDLVESWKTFMKICADE